uniref:Late endosomal/lysosomal adaptor and MAPK and MTOR activator 5 n=1 Tax=Heterorhabditis bacteriophora TaxID=37862 RepID=A0A1I7WXY4_HETBA
MGLNLNRTDFAQVGTTNRSCMQVIPSERIFNKKEKKIKKPNDKVPSDSTDTAKISKKRPLEKIVVGSQNGSVVCVCRRNNDTQILYKTLPGPPIESVCLGGAIGTLQDKKNLSILFVFFSFDTNMAETAKRMQVLKYLLIVVFYNYKFIFLYSYNFIRICVGNFTCCVLMISMTLFVFYLLVEHGAEGRLLQCWRAEMPLLGSVLYKRAKEYKHQGKNNLLFP